LILCFKGIFSHFEGGGKTITLLLHPLTPHDIAIHDKVSPVPFTIGKAHEWVGGWCKIFPKYSVSLGYHLIHNRFLREDSSSVAAQQWLAKNKLQLITPAFVTHANGASSRLAQHNKR